MNSHQTTILSLKLSLYLKPVPIIPRNIFFDPKLLCVLAFCLFLNGCQTFQSWFKSTDSTLQSIDVPKQNFARGFHKVVVNKSEVFLFGGLGEESKALPPVLASGWRYKISDESWRRIPDEGAPTPRFAHAFAVSEKHLFVWGGQGNGGDIFGDGALLNLATNQWQAIAPAPIGDRKHIEAVFTGTEFVVVGGTGLKGDADKIAAYDPAKNKWRVIGSLPDGGDRIGHSAVYDNGKIFLWGGRNASQLAASGWIIDPAANTFIAMATENQPTLRSNHSGVVAGNHLFVYGGSDGRVRLNTGASFDLSTLQWRKELVFKDFKGRSGHAAAALGSKVLIWGGRDSQQNFLDDGLYVDIDSGKWGVFQEEGLLARALHSMVTVRDRILLVGGFGPSEMFTLHYFADAYWLRPDDNILTNSSYCAEEACGE